ncbi:MAG: hypothetical protein NZ901_01210 [Geminocystis sp.]|nr:hypothetical protein [Geminocystis sp.]HIK36707.1 hypothetical protein [Geminocystis sp. M7585_C2015_104]MCS7146786.1 hypothetical protein [Geminocystis sp.]MCX8077064.1 hypothetical protein [Geminocystis sp.]MDW8115612.1 hypothetical protein [Geminocystis sp.]
MITYQAWREAKRTHRENLLRILDRRLEVAKAKGDTALVQQLEAERNYYLNG